MSYCAVLGGKALSTHHFDYNNKKALFMSVIHQNQGLKDPSRRRFLRVGLAGTAVLSTVGITAGVVGFKRVSSQDAATGYYFLRPSDVALFTALVPAVLGHALPQDDSKTAVIEEVVKRIDDTCMRLGSPNQKELTQLFDLLSFAPSRRLAAGLKTPWESASVEEATAFLERWRNSSVSLFNAAYRVLIKLPANAYYAMPESFAASGYPGPLAHMYNAIN